MPNYAKGTMGKLIVQDWTVLETYANDMLVLRWLTPRQCAALISLAEFLGWKTRYENPPGIDEIQAFEAETRYNLMTDVLFCALMINCITTDTDVQDAIVNMLLNNTEFQQGVQELTQGGGHGGGQVGESLMGQPLGNDNPLCDLDMAFGNIKYTVDEAIQRVYDLFEQIELVTDNQELILSLIDSIPFVGAAAQVAGVAKVFSYFDNVRDWMNDAFAAADTVDRRNELYCALLCLFQSDCVLTTAEIRNYLWEKTGELVDEWSDAFESVVNLIQAMANSTVSFGDGIFYAMLGAQFGLGYFVNDFFGLDFGQIKRHSVLGDPSDDWMALCDPCECRIIYSRPDNVPDDFVVEIGITGIAEILANSEPFDSGGGATEWIIGTWSIPLVGATKVQYVVDQPGTYSAEFYTDGPTFVTGEVEAITIAPGMYAISFDLGGYTGEGTIFNFRRAPIGNLLPYKWLQVRVYQPC